MEDNKYLPPGTIAPELADFYGFNQEDFEKYWLYYMEFSPDYWVE